MNDNNFFSWLAGFWEGEGSILKQNGGHGRIVFSISIGQSIRPGRNVESTMEKIKKNYGGNIYRYNYPNYKTSLQWRISKRGDVIKFINYISPYCQIRKQDLEEVLIYYKTHPSLINRFIDLGRVKELHVIGTTYEQISKIFNVSRMTIYRRLKKSEHILQS